MERALQEFRIRGVKTNVPFLLNVINHPSFRQGLCTTRFIDQTPELFVFPVRQDRASKLLTYAADVTVNGFPGLPKGHDAGSLVEPVPPKFDATQTPPPGTAADS